MEIFLISEKDKIKKLPKVNGVYLLENLDTNKKYFGSSGNLRKRIGAWRAILIRLRKRYRPHGVSKQLAEDGYITPLDKWKVQIIALTNSRYEAEELEIGLIKKNLASNSIKLYNERTSRYFKKEDSK